MAETQCPICSKPTDRKYAPFCSKRCADLDLSRWLKGSYAIAGPPAGEMDDGAPSRAEKTPENGGSEPSD